jgi:hypothetical protein
MALAMLLGSATAFQHNWAGMCLSLISLASFARGEQMSERRKAQPRITQSQVTLLVGLVEAEIARHDGRMCP